MKHIKHRSVVAAALVGLIAIAPLVHAQPSGMVHSAVRTSTFANGGIGDQDLQRMHMLAPKYPLHMLFAARPNGEYLAKVPVTIRDQQGNTVFEISNAGPLLYVDLPDGRYQITATVAGLTQTRNVSLHAHAASEVDFYWPQGAA